MPLKEALQLQIRRLPISAQFSGAEFAFSQGIDWFLGGGGDHDGVGWLVGRDRQNSRQEFCCCRREEEEKENEDVFGIEKVQSI